MANLELVIPASELITAHPERIAQILGSAMPYYNGDGLMTFHGPDHPTATTNAFLEDWVMCAAQGHETDIEAGVGATAHHDDDVHLSLEGTNFKTKEERSVAIAGVVLPRIGFTNAQTELAQGGVSATNAFMECTNLLEVQVVRADLKNTGLPYPEFLRYFIDFCRELRNLEEKFTPFNEVKEKQDEVLSRYFSRDLRYPFERECPLTVLGRANLERLRRDDEATVSAIAGTDFRLAS